MMLHNVMIKIDEHIIEINEDGSFVRNFKTQWKYKPSTGSAGYKQFQVYKNKKRKTYLVHRLVAQAFLNAVNNKNIVNHIDGNKLNNHYTNLEWVDVDENREHAKHLGLFKPGPGRGGI